MKIQIIHRACGGTEFLPQPSRLHLGAQNAEGVDRLQFQLPESWADCAIALYLRRNDGTQLAPVPLDGDACVTVDRRLTGCTGGQWMLALTNQVLSAMGKPVLPIESTTVEQLVTAGITTVAALISWWKNNSFTAAAVAADSYLARLKQKQ